MLNLIFLLILHLLYLCTDYTQGKYSGGEKNIKKYYQEQASKGEISSIKDNGDETYTIKKDGYDVTIDNEGKVTEIEEKEEAQPTDVWFKIEDTTLHLSNSDLGGYTKQDQTKTRPEWAGSDFEPSPITEVVFENKIVPISTSQWFYACENLEKIVNIEYLDTSQVTNMWFMFYKCSKLKEIDVSNFDTSNTKYMLGMFCLCTNLTELDLGNFDTSNVTSMSQMFQSCRNLKEVNLTSFDTRKVTDMFAMFVYCEKLVDLDLTSFDTNKVTTSGQMFGDVTCDIYVGSNWTLSEQDTKYSGTFIKK